MQYQNIKDIINCQICILIIKWWLNMNRPQKRSTYDYDFSYSATFDSVGPQDVCIPLQQQQIKIRESLIQWRKIFLGIGLLKPTNSSTLNQNFMQVINSQPYINLSEYLTRLYLLISKSEKSNSQLQKLRETIYPVLKTISDKFTKQDKHRGIILVTLVTFVIVSRVLKDIFSIHSSFQVFHCIVWEIKGQLVNQRTLTMFISENFDIQIYDKFMDAKKAQLEYLNHSKKMFDLPTFRENVGRELKSSDIYQSFRDVNNQQHAKNIQSPYISKNISPPVNRLKKQSYEQIQAMNTSKLKKISNSKTTQQGNSTKQNGAYSTARFSSAYQQTLAVINRFRQQKMNIL